MKKAFSALRLMAALAALLLTAACASPDKAAVAAPATATSVGKAADADAAPLTGSRLARRSSDRSVRSTDNQTFRDENQIRSLGNEVGMRSN
jgi:hypothetical protein